MNNNNSSRVLYLVLGISILALGYYFYSPTPKKEMASTSKASSSMSFFITSANPGKGGDLGGLAGADAYCTTLAEQAGVTGKTWKAYLSTTASSGAPAVNAKDRIGNGPWYNYKGELIASTLAELHANSKITKATAYTDKGTTVLGRGDTTNMHDILTGSNMNGMLVATSTDTTCSNWTSSATGSAYVGHHDRIGIDESAPMKSWNSSHLTRGCSQENLKSTGGAGLFYCFATTK